jgi:hypothetical protein
VAGVFPEKVSDEGLSGVLVPCSLQEIVLQLSGNPSKIENAVRALHPFQVDRDHAEAPAEQ